MRQVAFALTLAALLWPGVAGAQTTATPSGNPSSKAPPEMLGATLAEIPPVVYAQVPVLPRHQGVLVQEVGKNSVAEKIGLHRHDIILTYGNASVRDAQQLAGLVWSASAGQSTKLTILRGGKVQPIQYTFQPTDLPTVSSIKPSGPPALNLEVEPLANERVKVNLTYYAGGSSKLHTYTCEGTVEQVAKQLDRQKQQIPGEVQELLDVAVKRLRQLKMH